MKIGIHQEPSGTGLGGSELVAVVMAQALRDHHEVEIVHHRSFLTIEKLADYFGLDLEGVRLRYSPAAPDQWGVPGESFWRLGSDFRRWNAHLSEPYDLFLTSTHNVPPFCHSPKGVLYVHFPWFNRHESWPWTEQAGFSLRGVCNRLRKVWHEKLWRQRFAGYQLAFANSGFTTGWTKRYWGVSCKVLFPPVLTDIPNGSKVNQVVTLGRFTEIKNQLEMVEAFRDNVSRLGSDWSLACIGGMGTSTRETEYFDRVNAAASRAPVRLLANARREELGDELGRAKVFWHAVGSHVDENANPHLLEHFGIATVEAMAAGCVPVVLNRGGQCEIVEQGTSGFLCENLDEIVSQTVRLTHDDELRRRMAEAARKRAREFSREKFNERFLSDLKPLLS